MLRVESADFKVRWEVAPKATLDCPRGTLVTPDGCQECYVWTADARPGWCRIGAQRRALAAASLGPIHDVESSIEVQSRKRDALAWEWSPRELAFISACERVVAELKLTDSATNVADTAARSQGMSGAGKMDPHLAMEAARRLGRPEMVRFEASGRMLHASGLAVHHAVRCVMTADRDITMPELTRLVSLRTGIQVTCSLRAQIDRARARVIHADGV